MIPILFGRNERSFLSNGLGRLTETISCTVTEERNGVFEAELKYPVTGKFYDRLVDGMILALTHDDNEDRQPFRIYRRSAPINGIVTFNARHLCYDLRTVIVEPFTASSCSGALSGLATHAMTDCEFSFWTDKTTEGTWNLEQPTPAWGLLGGSQGSILDVYGTGEYKLDGTTVRLYLHRGSNKGVAIRYGKNLTKLTDETDNGETYNAIVPYWSSVDGETIYGDIVVGNDVPLVLDYWNEEHGLILNNESQIPFDFAYFKMSCVARDFTQNFQEQPTVSELNGAALRFLNDNKPWIPKQSLSVDFVPLWQTDEYAEVAPLQTVSLCDTVTVVYNELGVNVSAKVVKTVYNVLADRYDKIELGDARANFADIITGEMDVHIQRAEMSMKGLMDNAITHATELITGVMGGNILIKTDADGKPVEMLIMDTEDPATAVHVLRMNVNGIGFSSNGINGPYTTAWTIDGHFVADFITAGSLNASMISGGTLNGNDFTATNLTVTNANISGEMVAVQNEPTAYETGNKAILNNGKLELSRSNGDVIASLYTAYWSTVYGARPAYPVLEMYNVLSSPVKTVLINGQSGTISLTMTDGTPSAEIGYSSVFHGNVTIEGDLAVYGTKNRAVKTKSGIRLLHAYETAEPYFGDIGESEISEYGTVTVPIDPLFRETIKDGYQVFLQKYGNGDLWVSRRDQNDFTVSGTPGLRFAWEIKGKQIDGNGRLEMIV